MKQNIILLLCMCMRVKLAAANVDFASSGNLKDFEHCTLKFVRTDRDVYYRDINELLIAINIDKRNGYLMQTTQEGSLNVSEPIGDVLAQDFRVQENCAVTIIFKLTRIIELHKLRSSSFDNYRTAEFRNFVVANKNLEVSFT